MKNIFRVFILILFSLQLQAQDFALRVTDPTTTINPDPAVEFRGYYFVPVYSGNPNTYTKAKQSVPFYSTGNFSKSRGSVEKKIVRIDTSGTSYTIYHADTFDANHNILDLRIFDRDTCLEIIGLCKNKNKPYKYLFSIRMDEQFNVLSKTSSFIPDKDVNSIYKIMENYPGNSYILLGIVTDSSYYTRLSLAELNNNFNVTQFRNLHEINYVPEIAKAVEFEDFIYISPVTHLSIFRIAKDSLSITDTIQLPNFSQTIPTGVSFYHYDDSSFISPEIWTNLQLPYQYDTIQGITLYRRFFDGSVMDTMKFFNYDTSLMAGYECMDKYHPDSMFFVGTYNNSNTKVFGSHNTWIMISNIDLEDEKVHWVKYYGGDTYYYTFNVLRTSDGGCLVTAGVFDWITASPTALEFDLLVLKVNANGQVTSIKNKETPESAYSFTLYPNPATDKIRIRKDGKGKLDNPQLKIIDMQGRQVMTKQLNFQSSVADVNTKALKAGVYIFLLQDQSKTLIKGKFIKK
ncbi:MAG: T9SS type A sorting domain-containing protein [Bacteroidales bacterium]